MAHVTLNNIYKVYEGDVTAVRDVSLEIKDKEFIVLVGPSGCGKSTTLRMIAGLEDISQGQLLIGDRVVNDVSPSQRDIAMVFQDYALYPHMSVYENMAFSLKLQKLPKAEIDKKVREASRMLELDDYLERKPKALSGGQRQRVAMGRAVVRAPSVFLFDEPLSNLDAKMRVTMRAELSELHQRLQTTMIYVTHDQIEAMTLGDRIVVMKDGVIQQCAEPLDVYAYPANEFVASFIGTPPMNLFPGTIECKDTLTFKGKSFEITLPDEMKETVAPFIDKDVKLGIRPEDMKLEGQQGADALQYIDATMQLKETLGNELIAHLRSNQGETFLSRIDAHSRPDLTGNLKIFPIIQRMHVFDCATGKNITAPTITAPT